MEQSLHQLSAADDGLSKMILEVIQVAVFREINVSALIISSFSFPFVKEATLSSSLHCATMCLECRLINEATV